MTTLLCNVVSNVPAVMLLRTLVSGFPDPHTGWLALAMASTLAGNLTITGSVANIIVVERAAAEGVHVGFREYFRVGRSGDRCDVGAGFAVVVADLGRFQNVCRRRGFMAL